MWCVNEVCCCVNLASADAYCLMVSFDDSGVWTCLNWDYWIVCCWMWWLALMLCLKNAMNVLLCCEMCLWVWVGLTPAYDMALMVCVISVCCPHLLCGLLWNWLGLLLLLRFSGPLLGWMVGGVVLCVTVSCPELLLLSCVVWPWACWISDSLLWTDCYADLNDSDTALLCLLNCCNCSLLMCVCLCVLCDPHDRLPLNLPETCWLNASVCWKCARQLTLFCRARACWKPAGWLVLKTCSCWMLCMNLYVIWTWNLMAWNNVCGTEWLMCAETWTELKLVVILMNDAVAEACPPLLNWNCCVLNECGCEPDLNVLWTCVLVLLWWMKWWVCWCELWFWMCDVCSSSCWSNVDECDDVEGEVLWSEIECRWMWMNEIVLLSGCAVCGRDLCCVPYGCCDWRFVWLWFLLGCCVCENILVECGWVFCLKTLCCDCGVGRNDERLCNPAAVWTCCLCCMISLKACFLLLAVRCWMWCPAAPDCGCVNAAVCWMNWMNCLNCVMCETELLCVDCVLLMVLSCELLLKLWMNDGTELALPWSCTDWMWFLLKELSVSCWCCPDLMKRILNVLNLRECALNDGDCAWIVCSWWTVWLWRLPCAACCALVWCCRLCVVVILCELWRCLCVRLPVEWMNDAVCFVCVGGEDWTVVMNWSVRVWMWGCSDDWLCLDCVNCDDWLLLNVLLWSVDVRWCLWFWLGCLCWIDWLRWMWLECWCWCECVWMSENSCDLDVCCAEGWGMGVDIADCWLGLLGMLCVCETCCCCLSLCVNDVCGWMCSVN